MFDDIYKNIRLSMSERLSSPLMTSFVISWLIWNYRFVLIVFSSESIDEKLFLINQEVFPSLFIGILKGVIAPILSALAYVYIYPFFNKKIYKHYREQQREILNIRREIENETLLTKEESLKIRMELAKERNKNMNSLAEHTSEIEKLRDQIDLLMKENKKSEYIDTGSPRLNISSEHLKVLRYLWDKVEAKTANDGVSKVLNMDTPNVQYYLDDLKDMRLVDYIKGGLHVPSGYKINQEGRRFLKTLEQDQT